MQISNLGGTTRFIRYAKGQNIWSQFSVSVISSALVLRHEPITRFVINEIFDGISFSCPWEDIQNVFSLRLIYLEQFY